jgi:hypothetical protein
MLREQFAGLCTEEFYLIFFSFNKSLSARQVSAFPDFVTVPFAADHVGFSDVCGFGQIGLRKFGNRLQMFDFLGKNAVRNYICRFVFFAVCGSPEPSQTVGIKSGNAAGGAPARNIRGR